MTLIKLLVCIFQSLLHPFFHIWKKILWVKNYWILRVSISSNVTSDFMFSNILKPYIFNKTRDINSCVASCVFHIYTNATYQVGFFKVVWAIQGNGWGMLKRYCQKLSLMPSIHTYSEYMECGVLGQTG